MPHGAGKLVDADGDTYEGGFVYVEREGAGYVMHSNGDSFEGGFVRGKRHGFGVQRTAAGTTFEGEWVEDALSGQVSTPEDACLSLRTHADS